MALSRHAQIAQAVVDHLNETWGDKPAGMTITRSQNYEHVIKEISDGLESVVAVITPRIETETESRGTDIDTVPVFVCVIAALPDATTDSVDPWDLLTEGLRDELRGDAVGVLEVGDGVTARRTESAALPTPYDADYLDAGNLFFSVIELEYRVPIQVGA